MFDKDGNLDERAQSILSEQTIPPRYGSSPGTDATTARHERAIHALRTPDASLARVPNTVRQSIADVIEDQRKQIDKYGLALMMIREGCAEPAKFAGETLAAAPPRS